MIRTPYSTLVLCVSLVFFLIAQAGCGKIKKITGIGASRVSVSQGRLTADLTLTRYQTTQGFSGPVPYLAESLISFAPVNQGKGTAVSFSAPLKTIQKAIAELPEQGLMDGRPLPGIATGKLPAFDFKVERLALRFYLADGIFGVFVPVSLPKFGKTPFQFSVRDSRGYVVAYGFAIPSESGNRGIGLLVFFSINQL